MALSAETQGWLEGLRKDGGLSEEAFKQLETSLSGNAKADEYVKGSQLRQADYSRTMATVQTSQKAVEEATAKLAEREAAVTKYQAELGTWKQGADVNFRNAIKEREQAAVKAQAAIARLKSIAVANGLSEDDVLKDLDVVIPNPSLEVKQSEVDTSKFVTKEQIQQTIRESAFVDASIYDLSVRYQELTGKPLRDASQLVVEAIKANRPLSEYVAEKFKFADLEKAKSDADIQRRIDEAVTAERTKILSDAGLPNAGAGLRTDLQGSPIFAKQDNGTMKLPSETNAGGGISAAVAAFNSGKFKQGR